MATLAANEPRAYELGDIEEPPVAASTIIYEGSAVGDNASGYARPLEAADRFWGFNLQKIDNGSGVAGAKRVRLQKRGKIRLAIANLAITDVKKSVYASDDNTFVLTGGQNSFIGRVSRFVSSGIGIVEFNADERDDDIIVSLPINLASVADGDVLTALTPGFYGRIKKVAFAVTVPVTTAAKASTLNLEIGTTNLTGGAIALTSANCTPIGAIVSGTAITAGNTFGPTDTISVEASSTTAFAEGAGALLITLGR